jgi:glycyl-tRNA synthetase beta chain
VSVHDLLVEIGTEELPPKSLPTLSQAFADGIAAGLAAAGLRHGRLQPFATPRRLAVLVRRLAERQPDQEQRRRGPHLAAAFDAAGAPTRAAAAFAESCGTTVAALGRVTEAKGEFLFYSGTKPGAATATLLPAIVQTALEQLPIARRMRWGAGSAEFVRPVHWIVLLFGREVVPARILEVDAGRITHGHRFMARKPIVLTSPASYARRLDQAGKVVADFATRRERIRTGVVALARQHDTEAVVDEALLEEVTALVEWPVPIAGRFEERFLALPPEVLVATLKDHQRCFATRAPDGRLSPLFIAVSNIESRAPSQVRAGNERVVRPRLADAAFFWDADRRQTLASRREALKAVTFQAQLGSYHAKTERVARLALAIAAVVGAPPRECERAAQLSKSDLLTGLVGEFPELQGVMGSHYARHDGEPGDVAAAMAEQYLPRHAGDALPATRVGTVLALADKLDTITGIFAVGQRPSGTKDPFALRRAALGVLRITLEQRIDLDLPVLIAGALAAVRTDVAAVAAARAAAGPATPAVAQPVPESQRAGAAGDAVAGEVYDYIFERLRAHYLEGGTGVTAEMFDAVLDKRPASPLDFDARLRALGEFVRLPDAAALASANKRIANILRKGGHGGAAAAPREELLREPAECALAEALAALRPGVARALEARDYTGALRQLAALRPPVDAFFDKVLVMAEDAELRGNRLALLASLRELFLRVADLSRLPG